MILESNDIDQFKITEVEYEQFYKIFYLYQYLEEQEEKFSANELYNLNKDRISLISIEEFLNK